MYTLTLSVYCIIFVYTLSMMLIVWHSNVCWCTCRGVCLPECWSKLQARVQWCLWWAHWFLQLSTSKGKAGGLWWPWERLNNAVSTSMQFEVYTLAMVFYIFSPDFLDCHDKMSNVTWMTPTSNGVVEIRWNRTTPWWQISAVHILKQCKGIYND